MRLTWGAAVRRVGRELRFPETRSGVSRMAAMRGRRREHPAARAAVVSSSCCAVPGSDGADSRGRREAGAGSEAASNGGRCAPEPPTNARAKRSTASSSASRGRRAAASELEFYEQKAKVWKPLRRVRVSALRRARSRTSSSRGRGASAVGVGRVAVPQARAARGKERGQRIDAGGLKHQAAEAHSAAGPGLLSRSCTSWRRGSPSTRRGWCSLLARSALARRSGST